MPDGFDTQLGEHGLRLSGGQRQRLAIARAALRDAPFVVLDEFTAHLDDRTEAQVLEAVGALLRGRTALVIAHRGATIAAADRVVTLDRGAGAGPPGRGCAMTSATGSLGRVVRAVGGYRWWILAAALLSFVTLGSGIGLIALSAYLISRSALVDTTTTLALTIVGVRFFAVTRAVARYAERYVGHLGTFRILTRIRVWLFRGLEPVAPAGLMDRRGGDVLSGIVDDVDTMQDLYLRVVGPTPCRGAGRGTGAVRSWAPSAPCSAVTLVGFLVLCGVVLPLVTRHIGRAPAGDLVRSQAEVGATTVEGLTGLADLVAAGRQDLLVGRLDPADGGPAGPPPTVGRRPGHRRGHDRAPGRAGRRGRPGHRHPPRHRRVPGRRVPGRHAAGRDRHVRGGRTPDRRLRAPGPEPGRGGATDRTGGPAAGGDRPRGPDPARGPGRGPGAGRHATSPSGTGPSRSRCSAT